MKSCIIIAIICFTAGFGLEYYLTLQHEQQMEANYEAAIEKVWGFQQGEGKEFVGRIGELMPPEEVADMLHEVAKMGSEEKSAYHESLLALFSLAFFEHLKSGNSEKALDLAGSSVTKFYLRYRNTKFTDGDIGTTSSETIKKIESAMKNHPELREESRPEPDGAGQPM